jgi:hypothetical protein
MEFYKVEEDIKEILKNDMVARCDDMALYANYVYTKLSRSNEVNNNGWLIKVFSDRRFRIIHGIAPYGTVSRVRRRLQEENINLRPSEYYLKERKRAEREYKKYATERGRKSE